MFLQKNLFAKFLFAEFLFAEIVKFAHLPKKVSFHKRSEQTKRNLATVSVFSLFFHLFTDSSKCTLMANPNNSSYVKRKCQIFADK
jgi:uncharacterized membrane protein SpoIIM required for sporulation